ncbi:family transcriptional regulator [Leptolyngbya sp. Heron Island J]|nr:family transcriptional regulator [Leptolyngbya sp. Heron Island J]
MQSQINFVNSQTLQPAPTVNAGKILVSSKDLNWDGIYIEKGENDSFNPDDVTVPQHYFAMNVGQPFEWEWQDGRTFKTHCYGPGELWVNPAGVPFSHRINTYNQFVLLTLDPAKVVEVLPDYPLLERRTFRRQHKVQDRHLQMLLQSLLVEAESGGRNGKLYADALSMALAAHFVNHYSADTPLNLSVAQTIERQRLGQVIDYIDAYLTENLSLNDLALVAGLSKFHFSRLFKQAFGVTPHRYLMQRRVERATTLLKQTTLRQHSLTIAEIAHQLRFADQSHFTRVFKQIKGVTPKQFLQQI